MSTHVTKIVTFTSITPHEFDMLGNQAQLGDRQFKSRLPCEFLQCYGCDQHVRKQWQTTGYHLSRVSQTANESWG